MLFLSSILMHPFRGGEGLCFGAYDTYAANKYMGHLHSRGGGARASHLTPGYQSQQASGCGCHDVTALHYPYAINHLIHLPYPYGRMQCVPTCGCQDAAATM